MPLTFLACSPVPFARQSAPFVRARLCITLAALAVQSAEWTNVVPELVNLLSSDAALPALLDVLQALPVEANSSRVRVDHRMRRAFRVRGRGSRHAHAHAPVVSRGWRRGSSTPACACPRVVTAQDELDGCACNVLKLLINKLPTVGSDTRVMARLVEVATVWVRHCYIAADALVDTNIVATAFQALTVEVLFESAAALLVELLERYHNHERHRSVVFALIPGLLDLEPKFLAAKADGDQEAEREYVRMFSAMGLSYVSLILGEVRRLPASAAAGAACSRVVPHAAPASCVRPG